MLNKKYTPIYIMILLFVVSFSFTVLIGKTAFNDEFPSESTPSQALQVSSVSSKVEDVDSKVSVTSSVSTDIEIDTATDSDTETETETDIPSTQTLPADQQPLELTNLLEAGESSYSALSGTQLVTVDVSGAVAKVTCWEKSQQGKWEEVKKCDGFIGYWGLSDTITNSDRLTPAGMFEIGTGFGFDESFETSLDYFEITQDTYWITDSSSKYFNTHMESEADKDWNDSIVMSEYSAYKYGVEIKYDGNVGGVFLCCGDECTKHDVAVPESDMKEILSWLSKQAKPCILII